MNIWPAYGPSSTTTGVLGELAISFCGIHSTGLVTGWSSKRPGVPSFSVVKWL